MSLCRITNGRHTFLRKGVLIVGLFGSFCGWTSLAAQGRLDVRSAGSISVKGSDRTRLEDIDPDGRVLILNRDPDSQEPDLLVWDPGTMAFVRRIRPDWTYAPRWVPSGGDIPRSFRVTSARGDLVGALGYYLAVIDGKRDTLHRVLCAPDLKEPKSPYTEQSSDAWSYVHGTVIARYNYSGLVAAAFNFGKWPRLFLLRPPWNAPSASWRMDRFVKALAWSHDGKTLAVLYSNAFNDHLKFVNAWHRGGVRNTLPDVALIDLKTGKTRLKFFSGDYQSSIVFSPDGKFIYCAGFGPASPRRGWVVRKFSASNGKLVRKIKERGLKLRGDLAVSPDGRYLVADASSTRFSLGVIFNDTSGYDRRFRFVVIDTATGKVVFKHEERAADTLLVWPPTFAFSPDGEYLYVDPHLHGPGSPEIQVYSLREKH